MNNRRSFLKMLGLSAVAAPAPAAANLAIEAEAAPKAAYPIMAKWRRAEHWRTTELLEAQHELNRVRSAQLAILTESRNYRLLPEIRMAEES